MVHVAMDDYNVWSFQKDKLAKTIGSNNH